MTGEHDTSTLYRPALNAAADTLSCIKNEDFTDLQKAKTIITAYEAAKQPLEEVSEEDLRAAIEPNWPYSWKEFPPLLRAAGFRIVRRGA